MSRIASKLRLFLPVFVLTGFILGCSPEDNAAIEPEAHETAEKTTEHENESGLHLSKEDIQQAGITVEEVSGQTISDQLILTANIAANQDRLAHVSPRVEGKLIKVTAKLGDAVKSGEALAVIDSIQVGEARAEYRRTQSELKLAEANFQRADRLYREQVVPQKQWLESKSTFERAQSAARAESERLRMYGALGGEGATTFVVTAPFSGVVIEKNAVLGELARPTETLFTVADISTVWIEADVTEKDIRKLDLGAAAAVRLPAYPGETFLGKVSYISNTFDRDTRTVKARIELPNPEGKLRIDMFAEASISFTGTKSVITVPGDAILMLQGQSTVYVANGDSYEPRPVVIGERLSDGVVVTSGLEAGDQVVVAGAYALKARQLKSQIGDAD